MRSVVFLMSITLVFGSIYTIEGVFDATDMTLHGTVNVLWTNRTSEATSLVLFNLFPNLHEKPNPEMKDYSFAPGGIDIEGVWSGNEKLEYDIERTFIWTFQDYSKDRTLLKVKLPEPIQPGSSVEISVKFELRIPESEEGDEYCTDGFCLWRFGWYPLEVYVKNGTYSKGAVYTPHECHASIEVPKGWKFITHEGWGVGCPLVLLRGYEELTLGTDYRVHVHYMRGRRERAYVVGGVVLKALERYSERFGKLDYRDVHVLQSPNSGLFGMTANGVITLGDNAFTTADLLVPGFTQPVVEFLVFHEVAHLWFGIGTTVDFSVDNFLSESLAQYAAITEMEEVYDPWENLYDPDTPDVLTWNLKKAFRLRSLRENYHYLYSTLERLGLDTTVRGPHGYLNQYFPVDYAKGYFAMRSLEVAMGKEGFDSVLKEYIKGLKGKVGDYEAFKSLILKREPDLESELAELFENGKGIDLRVEDVGEHVQIDAPNGFSYEVLITRTDGSTELLVETGPATFEGVLRVDVDPNWKVPDPDRFNNHFPVLLSGFSGDYISPLESYKLTTPSITLSTGATETAFAFGLGLGKFGYWSFGILAGVFMETLKATETMLESLYGGWGAVSDPRYGLSVVVLGGEDGLKVMEIEGWYDLFEDLDVGYTPLYRYSRFGVQGSLVYTPEIGVGTLALNFFDPLKSGIFASIGSRIYLSPYFMLGEVVPFFHTSYILDKRFDLTIYGLRQMFSNEELLVMYLITGGEVAGLRFSSYYSASVGLHMGFTINDRLNLFNLLSLRGALFSIRLGFEGGDSSGRFEKFLSGELSVTPIAFTMLDTAIQMRFYLKYMYGLDSDVLGYTFGIDSDLPEMIVSQIIAWNPGNPLRELRIRPSPLSP